MTNIFQFSANHYPLQSLESGGLLFQCGSTSVFTQCTNDSIVCSFPFIPWGTGQTCDSIGRSDHTSQFSGVKQRPPAIDLSGPKASAKSLTPRRSNLAVAKAIDFQLNFFSFAVALSSEFSSGRGSCCTRSRTAGVPAPPKRMIRHGSWGESVDVLSDSCLDAIRITDRGEEAHLISRLGPLPVATLRSGSGREWLRLTSFLSALPCRFSLPSSTCMGLG